MNPDHSHTSITSRLKLHKRRRDGPASLYDVSKLVPERPVPAWIRHRVKGGGSGHSRSSASRYDQSRGDEARKHKPCSIASAAMLLDLNNMRKDWKSTSTRQIEAVQRARVSQNRRPEQVRRFPGDIRPISILSDSPVALFAQSKNTGIRKKFDSPTSLDATTARLKVDNTARGAPEALPPLPMEKTFLTLDQSKLPLEVQYAGEVLRGVALLLALQLTPCRSDPLVRSRLDLCFRWEIVVCRYTAVVAYHIIRQLWT